MCTQFATFYDVLNLMARSARASSREAHTHTHRHSYRYCYRQCRLLSSSKINPSHGSPSLSLPLSRFVCLAYQSGGCQSTRRAGYSIVEQLASTCAVRCGLLWAGAGGGWVLGGVSQPCGKVALGFLAYFYACRLTSLRLSRGARRQF